MKYKILALLLLITYPIISFSQNIVRQELTLEEIRYLAKDINTFLVTKSDDYKSSIKNNLINYEFEIQYENKPIFRGAINKPTISSISRGMFRTSAMFCFEYNLFDAETKLELIENKKLKLSTSDEGVKYLWTDEYKLFDLVREELTVNDKIAKKIQIKFFKTIY